MGIRWGGIALAVIGLAPAAESAAQAIPFSQHGTVSQRVGITDIMITYNRPVARGRQLFPGLVAWNKPWTPGADSATRIRFTQPVQVEGQAVAAGEYSLWLVPREAGPWELVLHQSAHVFHLPYPGPDGEAVRTPVETTAGDHMETLALYFPVVARDSAVLRVHWGRTVVPIRIRTMPLN